MGKNHRHIKRLKCEKSKTQLKTVNNFLLKGQNVTNTEFKVKPIVIIPQLQSTSTFDGHRDLDLKEVLCKLKHYNENMKIKACEDMNYLVKNNINKFLRGNISTVIPCLAEFIQIKLPKARRAGLNMISIFLKSFSSIQLEPHFHYFSVNLRCAMTHIDRNIQEDSILFLDCFLTNVPTLIAKHSNQILPDFLTLLSKHSDSEFKRTVSVNLDSKFTSIGWRSIVLSRLYVFLEAIISDRKLNEMNQDTHLDSVTFNADSFTEHAILKSWPALFNPRIDIFGSISQMPKYEDPICKNCCLLIPLLLEAWLEGAPVKLPSEEVTYISEETSALLSCVTKVYYLLWSYLNGKKGINMKTTFMMPECQRFMKHIVQNLPYCLINRPKQQNKPNKFLKLLITDVKCTEENLLICYLYFVLYCKNPSKAKQNDVNNIVTYVTGILLRDYGNSNMDMTYVMMILRHLLVDEPKAWSRSKVAVHHLLENAIIMFNKGNINQSAKSALLKLLSGVKLDILVRNPSYESWLESLPKLLLEDSVSEYIIDSMFDMSRKNVVAFLRGFLYELPLILGNLPNLNITNSSDQENAKNKIVDALYYMPSFDVPFVVLEKAMEKNSAYWSRVNYIFDMRNES